MKRCQLGAEAICDLMLSARLNRIKVLSLMGDHQEALKQTETTLSLCAGLGQVGS